MADRAASTRNIALIGHGDCGKTTFAEHALNKAGATKRVGSVPDGTTVTDFDPDEKSRGYSIDATPIALKWKDKSVQMVDCPGYPDFRGAATMGLWACETSLLFVDAASGMGVNTRRMWRAAARLSKARAVVISRMDHDQADPEKVLASVQRAFGARCLPFNLPIGTGSSFSGVAPCLGDAAGESEAPSIGDIDEAKNALLESIVEADDDMLERYLGGEEISPAELRGGLRVAMTARTVVPVLFLSNSKGVGVSEILDFVADYAPTAEKPIGVTARVGDGELEAVDSDGPFLASVFKITSDVHVGKQSFVRVWRGSLPGDGQVWNSATDSMVKVVHPTQPHANEFKAMKTAGAGDFFCVAKLDDLTLGATLTDPSHRAVVEPPHFHASMVQLAVTGKARGEEHKIATALSRLAEEDPSFSAERNSETNELVIAGRSSLHLDVVMNRAKSRFKIDMATHIPLVPLKETVQATCQGHHRHKKQTGGRGQFGEVYLRIAPQERGTGFEFVDKTVGGSIPRNFMPAIEKGIREQMQKGIMAGFPVVDVRIEVYDGKFHPVDSSEAAFKMAGGKAFRDAFTKAKPALLEPIMNIEIDVPSRFMGDITGDLNTRRGRITGMDAHDDNQVISAQVPLSEVQSYSTELRSITSGEGVYNLEFSHLEVVPAHVAQKLIDEYEKNRTDDD